MRATCDNRGCTREAEFERPMEVGQGRVVYILRCEPCKELHAYRAEFRPIREAEVA